MRWGLAGALLMLCGGFLGPLPGYPAGFAVPHQGAAAMAQSSAFAARADDPSSVFYNPAGIAHLEASQVMLGTTVIVPSVTFVSGGTSLSGPAIGTRSLGSPGLETGMDDRVFFPSHLFYTHRRDGGPAFGLGFFSHFGLATTWPRTWEGRYVQYDVDVKTFFVNPTVAYRPSPGLALGMGIQYAYSTAELKQKIFLGGSSPDADLDLGVSDGDGWGYNLGVLVRLTGETQFGASYRSPVRIRYGGKANYTVPATAPPAVRAVLSDTTAKTELAMPPIFIAGVAHRPIEALALELDVMWMGWSSIDRFQVQFDNPLNPVTSTPKRWNDVIALRVGGEYRLSEAWAFRAGYAFDPSPIPGDTIDSIVPDATRHDLSVGIGFRTGWTSVDLAYQTVFFNDRNVNNRRPAPTPVDPAAVYNQVGTYQAIAHLFGIGLTYRF